MMELTAGEAGVLRTALGVVLGTAGIDVRVRVYLWSGGVDDVVLPTINAQPFPAGAQVIVLFLGDRVASGMVIGTIEGLLSWRRTAAPAFGEYIQPHLLETMARAGEPDGVLTRGVDFFAYADDDPQGVAICAGCVLMADGRVFLVPATCTGDTPPLVRPRVYDPATGALHAVEWVGPVGASFRGGCLLQDGRVFFMPDGLSASPQAYVYDPLRDRVFPAGEAVAAGVQGCVLLADGRVLLLPYSAPSLLIYDPRAEAVTVSQVVTPPALQTGQDFGSGQLLPDGRVLLIPYGAGAAMVYDPASDTAAVVAGDLGGGAYDGGVLLADGRVCLVPAAPGPVAVFDPATDSVALSLGPAGAGGWRGGALLADGRVLMLPQQDGLAFCRIWDPATNTFAPPPGLSEVEPELQQSYAGGVTLPDGRVLFVPYYSRDLVLWDPGCGVAFSRDVALSAFWNRAV